VGVSLLTLAESAGEEALAQRAPDQRAHPVASTTSSRRPLSALPTISSDSPREYTSAVSMKLIPSSRALWMIRTESSWSGLPQAPNIMVPRQ
jgi:hypothetical protein